VRSEAYVNIQKTVRDTIRRIGYTKAEYRFDADSCGVLSDIHEQSGDINRAWCDRIQKNRGPETKE
jgi:S-adenosylmethionine synthetase